MGITEAKAKEIYGADKVVALKYNLAGNSKSKILNTAGEIKLVQVKDGAVVGVHVVGDRMGEQVGEAQLIYNWEALPAEVAQLIHAHPTQNEAMGEAHLALAGKPLHSRDSIQSPADFSHRVAPGRDDDQQTSAPFVRSNRNHGGFRNPSGAR